MTTVHTRAGSKRFGKKSKELVDEEPVDEVNVEGKIQDPIPTDHESAISEAADSTVSPLTETLSSVRELDANRCSLAISQRDNSLPAASVTAELSAGIDTSISLPETPEDEYSSVDENVSPYNPVEAVNGIAEAVVQNLAEEAEPMPEYINLSSEEKVSTNEPQQTAGAVLNHTVAATNESEVVELTILRGAIKDLQRKVELQSPNHPGYAVDYKLLLILQTLEKRFVSPEGKRVLRAEANIYHKGNIFDAEKSFIHTFRQSLLLRMAPPTARKFHDHKNTELKNER